VIVLFMWLAGAVHTACQDLPTNRFVRRLRSRPARRAGVAALLLGAAYAVAGALCAHGASSGWSGWLHLGVLVFWWNASKLVCHGIIALIRSLGVPSAGGQVSPVLGDGVDAGAERGRGLPLPVELGGGRRR
jgi:hypothetical protein